MVGMVGENLKIPPGRPAGAIFPRRTRGAVERKATSPFGGVQCSAPAASPSSTAARHPVEGLLHGWLKSTVRRRHERRTGGEVRQRPQRRRVGRDWNRKGNETGSTSGGGSARGGSFAGRPPRRAASPNWGARGRGRGGHQIKHGRSPICLVCEMLCLSIDKSQAQQCGGTPISLLVSRC